MTPIEVEAVAVDGSTQVAVGRPRLKNTKRHRYFRAFQFAIAEHRFHDGRNEGVKLMLLNNFIVLRDSRTYEIIFSVPYSHGHLKRVFFIFGLLGYEILKLREYLLGIIVEEVLIEDGQLSPESSEGFSRPIFTNVDWFAPPGQAMTANSNNTGAEIKLATVAVDPHANAACCCIM